MPFALQNNQGNRTAPSHVAFTDSERLVGEAAKNQAAMSPQEHRFITESLGWQLQVLISFIFSCLNTSSVQQGRCVLASSLSPRRVVCSQSSWLEPRLLN
jgi:hypothetical protein